MKEVLLALENAIKSENWYGALIIALVIPDICSKLETPSEVTNKRYPAWFDAYKDASYNKHLSGFDCYALRCAYLHEGVSVTEDQSIKEKIDSFSFSPGGCHLISMSNFNGDKKSSCHLSVKKFCEDMKNSAEKWLQNIQSNQEILNRIKGMIKIQVRNEFHDGGVSLG